MRQVEHVDLKIDMDAVLATMRPEQRRGLILFMQGHTTREAGKIIGVDHSTICRYLKELRTKMHSWVDYKVEATCDNARAVNQ